MISLIKQGNSDNSLANEYRGLSTDTKPTGSIPNGSMFIEIDTGKIYFFDEQNNEWIAWS